TKGAPDAAGRLFHRPRDPRTRPQGERAENYLISPSTAAQPGAGRSAISRAITAMRSVTAARSCSGNDARSANSASRSAQSAASLAGSRGAPDPRFEFHKGTPPGTIRIDQHARRISRDDHVGVFPIAESDRTRPGRYVRKLRGDDDRRTVEQEPSA